ncbi:MAG: CooT family nickel-binding protein [Deltaproteobacteria bacterium]|nr:CooT family nickel-binding protein [Deltaproteobacteria bacterium]
MCQSNVYLQTENGEEKLVMEDVSLITPLDGGETELVGLFGDRLTVKARIKEMDLLKHRIVMQATEAS